MALTSLPAQGVEGLYLFQIFSSDSCCLSSSNRQTDSEYYDGTHRCQLAFELALLSKLSLELSACMHIWVRALSLSRCSCLMSCRDAHRLDLQCQQHRQQKHHSGTQSLLCKACSRLCRLARNRALRMLMRFQCCDLWRWYYWLSHSLLSGHEGGCSHSSGARLCGMRILR